MRKIFITVLAMLLFSTSAFAFTFPFFKKVQKPASSDIETMELFDSESKSVNRVWAGTFELVWNDLMDNVIGRPIEFSNGKSALAQNLNKQNFKKESLSENSYYIAHGWMTRTLKSKIEKGIKEKFNEKSDILDGLDWSDRNFLIYAMLKKDFEFLNEFSELQKEKFANSKEDVKYFGINASSKSELKDSVNVLFYNSDNDYAVKLRTKSDDKVILYRTNDDKSFANAYKDMLTKSEKYNGNSHMTSKDRLKVPYVEFKTKHFYKELENKMIKYTDFMIMQALETIDFKMDNKGVKLKSEAAIVMKLTAVAPQYNKPRYFYFDDSFYLFLIEKDKPYFALRVGNTKPLVK